MVHSCLSCRARDLAGGKLAVMTRFVLLAAIVLPACVEPQADIAPRILVDACAGGSETVGAFIGGVDDCALTLQLAVAAPTNFVVTLMNPSNERLTLTSVELSPQSSPDYALVESPVVIPAGETAEIAPPMSKDAQDCALHVRLDKEHAIDDHVRQARSELAPLEKPRDGVEVKALVGSEAPC